MQIKQFKKVLVANRGEIAIRIFRALSELGIRTVGIYSKEDKYALFRTKADESYLIGKDKGPIDAYLDMKGIIQIAKSKQVDAIHPGYGFLSENTEFAQLCSENGIEFIGPEPETMLQMGDKISAKEVALQCGVPTIPGYQHPIKNYTQALDIAQEIGYPVILKAANGGGGRGMRIVSSSETMQTEFQNAMNESIKAFNSDVIFMEKYLLHPKHIEVQILGDKYGNIVHLFERDCSLQRRHQKVIEFAPSFSVDEDTKKSLLSDSVKLAKKVNYSGAGTMEFLVDKENNYYFIEMNPRIQVEHTVTEMITGIDIVQSQVLIAMGHPLNSKEIDLPSQESINVRGFSIQCRVTTENPNKNFMPDTGKISVYRSASGSGIRLDGGNGFTGAEISPYYDSLLVKTTSWDRTFEGAARKALRSIKEFRVRGVKTNIPFLINVLNHPTFLKGDCYTSFIEDTKDLFEIKGSKDRASKLMNFIGDIIVNERYDPAIEDVNIPSVELPVEESGTKQLFEKLGAEEFARRIKQENKLYVTDTTMRDAHQSLFATRMRSYDMMQIAPACNTAFKDAFSMETWGGATFDVAYRFLKESPWRRLEKLTELMPNVLQQMLLRASNAVGYKNYPDNVVKEFIKVSAERGVDVFRIFDSLNWMENMKLPVETALGTGKIVEGTLCYTSDILDKNNTKYDLSYYVKKARELESMGIHILGIKDMAGLLKPYAAKELITALKKEIDLPIHLHTHDTSGNAVATVLMAAEAGVDIADMALESMSGLTSQPSLNAVVAALQNTPRDTGLNIDHLNEVSNYFKEVRKIYSKFESELKTPSVEIYRYEIPGGQYSNLLPQAKSLGLADRFEEIKEAYREANLLLGDIVKVTPSSKIVGDLAVFMVKNDLTRENIFTQGENLSFPDSVVEFFMGYIGQPEGGFPKELQRIVLKGKEAISVRPGLLLPDEDFKAIGEHLNSLYGDIANPRNILSYALYPKVYSDYCKHIDLYNDISNLPSSVFFYGLRKGQEIDVEIEDGKVLNIRYTGYSEADEQGVRSVYFELNGSSREVEVLDRSVEVKKDSRRIAEKGNPKHIAPPIPGTVTDVLVKAGDTISVNQPLMVVEAMKMETTVLSTSEGKIEQVLVVVGDTVADDELVITLE
ncbi:MAG: pyruvate carboxylase [Filifactor alocis]|nr:pyruvate carboxylase [Filifactor alocis]